VLPTTRITGSLTYWSPRDARIDSQAKIQGGVTHNLPEMPRALARTRHGPRHRLASPLHGGLMVTGVGLLPGCSRASRCTARTPSARIRSRAWGIGLLLVVLLPVIAILTMLTILGIPLGLILFVLYSRRSSWDF